MSIKKIPAFDYQQLIMPVVFLPKFQKQTKNTSLLDFEFFLPKLKICPWLVG